jgi:hypothetical protein
VSEREQAFIEGLRAHEEETRKLLSGAQKPERERMVVRAFLRCVGEPFDDSEVRVSNEEPVDTFFRDARFQVRDVVGNKKRGKDSAQRAERYGKANELSDLLEPWEQSKPMTFSHVSVEIVNALADKASRYGARGCATLDALVYVDLRGRHLYPPAHTFEAKVMDELDRQGWRSVSTVFVPYGFVLAARSDAPEFLRRRVGYVLKEWPHADGWFEP